MVVWQLRFDGGRVQVCNKCAAIYQQYVMGRCPPCRAKWGDA